MSYIITLSEIFQTICKEAGIVSESKVAEFDNIFKPEIQDGPPDDPERVVITGDYHKGVNTIHVDIKNPTSSTSLSALQYEYANLPADITISQYNERVEATADRIQIIARGTGFSFEKGLSDDVEAVRYVIKELPLPRGEERQNNLEELIRVDQSFMFSSARKTHAYVNVVLPPKKEDAPTGDADMSDIDFAQAPPNKRGRLPISHILTSQFPGGTEPTGVYALDDHGDIVPVPITSETLNQRIVDSEVKRAREAWMRDLRARKTFVGIFARGLHKALSGVVYSEKNVKRDILNKRETFNRDVVEIQQLFEKGAE